MSLCRAKLITATAIVLAVASPSASAQSSMGQGDLGAVIYARDTASRAGQQAAGALLQRAQDRGRVRVIVGLDVALRDEDELSASQQSAQSSALDEVQNAVAWRSVIQASRVIKYESVPYMSAFVTRAQLQRLLRDPQVVSIQEDVPVQAHVAESVPLIQANFVWQQGFPGSGRTVVVLDTGADNTHSMLRNRVVAGLCRSTTTSGPPATTSTCPGEAPSSNTLGSGKPCTGAPSCDHGTHVSSIAMGRDSNLKGVARSAKLISGKVFSLCPTCSQGTTAWFSDINSALDRVHKTLRKQFKIDSINMSLGGGGPFDTPCDSQLPATAELINKLFNKGIATVISSGNNGFDDGISSPACIDRAIAVGSTNKDDSVSSFSNHHAMVDVMAPGGLINAAVPGGSYSIKSGTSMAAPHVIGAIALLRDAVPGASVNQILNALKRGDTVSSNGVDKPRINLRKAYKKLTK